MAENDEVVFILTKDDVLTCARELDIPEETITDDILRKVRKACNFGFEFWSEVVKDTLTEALK